MSSLNQPCDICRGRNQSELATYVCAECSDFLCFRCIQKHSESKATRQHKAVPISKYTLLPRSVIAIKHSCELHDAKLDYFCRDHGKLCCVKCISEKHMSCHRLVPLPVVVKENASAAEFESLLERIKIFCDCIKQTREERVDKRRQIGEQTLDLLKEIANIRASVKECLDNLQAVLEKDLFTIFKSHSTKITSVISNLDNMTKDMRLIQDDLGALQHYGTDLQMFGGITLLAENIIENEARFRNLQNDKSLESIEINLSISEILLTLQHKLQEFGQIRVTSCETPLVELQWRNNIDNVNLKKIRNIQVPKGKHDACITGCEILDSGTLVFADYKNCRLVILDIGGTFIRDIKLDHPPLDVMHLSGNIVATTVPATKRVFLFNIYSGKLTQIIDVFSPCYGLCLYGKDILVVIPNFLYLVELPGKLKSRFQLNGRPMYMSTFKDDLYCSCSAKDQVMCYKFSGDQKWHFTCEKQSFPLGLTNDNFGNVLAVCQDSNKLLIIDKDGSRQRTLLDRTDELITPRAIHLNKKTNKLLICNETGGTSFLYQIM